MPNTIIVRINFGAPGWLAQLVKRPTLGFRLRVVSWSPYMGLALGVEPASESPCPLPLPLPSGMPAHMLLPGALK